MTIYVHRCGSSFSVHPEPSLQSHEKGQRRRISSMKSRGLWTRARAIPKYLVCKGSTAKLDPAQCPHTPHFLYQSLLFYGKDVTSGHTGQKIPSCLGCTKSCTFCSNLTLQTKDRHMTNTGS